MLMLEDQVFKDGRMLMAVATVDRLERETARKTIEAARESFGLNYGDLASALEVTRRMLLRYRKYEGRFGDTSLPVHTPYTLVTSCELAADGIGGVSMAVYTQPSLSRAHEPSI